MANLIIQGLNTPQIASELHVTKDTVKSHRKSIYSKLDAHNLVQFINKYMKFVLFVLFAFTTGLTSAQVIQEGTMIVKDDGTIQWDVQDTIVHGSKWFLLTLEGIEWGTRPYQPVDNSDKAFMWVIWEGREYRTFFSELAAHQYMMTNEFTKVSIYMDTNNLIE